jgi:hypothetical protein
MNDSVVAIVSAFFIIGIAVGIISVIALSVLRDDRRGLPREPGPGRGDAGPDDRPRWPGDADKDFSR